MKLWAYNDFSLRRDRRHIQLAAAWISHWQPVTQVAIALGDTGEHDRYQSRARAHHDPVTAGH
jgi:hypothetical protein